ncbi:MAG: ABC transporter permease [Tatlockia sp.]|nr:ABC transporter permease [Tatlockia sp.]
MRVPQRHRYYGEPTVASIINFFGFLGHVFSSFVDIFQGKLRITRLSLLNTIYDTGAKLLFPLLFITSLLGVSIIINIFNILSPFDLQNKVLTVSQQILFYDFLPFLISIMLAMQAALNLVNAQIQELNRTPHEVVLTYIIPIMIGTNISALFLYMYALNIVIISIFFCFKYLLNTNISEYLFHLTTTFTPTSIIYSTIKMIMYCCLVSLIVGYYYYQVASGHLLIRVAMSRIITRSFMWLAFFSVYFKFINY